MQQRPDGPNGEYTDEQKKRSILYSFSLMSSSVGNPDEDKEILKNLALEVNEITQ